MAGSIPALWIDGAAFGIRVLRGGDDPWRTPGELGLFARELAALLSLRIVDIDVAAALDAWCDLDGIEISNAADLEDALGNPVFVAHLARGIETVTGALGQMPLALALPGPGLIARRHLGDDADEDTLDDLSLALAGLLRAVYRPGLVVFRLTEADPRALEFLDPLLNIARHYGVEVALILNDGASDASIDGVKVYRAGETSNTDGKLVPAAFWEGADALPPGDDPVFAEVPAGMVPETVLARLRQLQEHTSGR